MINYSNLNKQKHKGLTLIEVAVAVAILAVIYTISSQTLSAAADAGEVSERNTKRLEEIEKFWFFVYQDLRNFINHDITPARGEVVKNPFIVNQEQDEWFSVLRAGNANPTGVLRTELMRVEYVYADEEIVRRSWNNPATTDEDFARELKLLTKVEDLQVRVLPPTANSLKDPWKTKWDKPADEELPVAIEITVTLADKGEMRRLFRVYDFK